MAATVLAVLVVLPAIWWYGWAAHWRPGLAATESYGIDVSHHQGRIDWRRVAADNIDFAYIKATEGVDFTDRRFAENWREADRAGVRRGAYHFFTLCGSGAEQAAHFVRTAPPEARALPPAVDLELAGNCKDRPSRTKVYAELDSFLAAVEGAWSRPMLLYVGSDWERRYPVVGREERPLWLLSLLGRPDERWAIWQVHGFARVDGVRGRVDLDVGRLSAVSGRSRTAPAGRGSR